MMEGFFWISLALLVHTYLLYPVLLKILSLFRPPLQWKPILNQEELPKISLIFSAYNEEAVLEDKIKNLNALKYPKDKLEILIGSDGSKDQTGQIIQNLPSPYRPFVYTENRGKASVLNDLVEESTAEILVFCDANTFFLPNALQLLAAAFSNEQVGCVSGRLLLNDSGKTSLGEGESIYWQLESKTKELEGHLRILMGVNGAIYAIKRKHYTTIPSQKKITDDFFLSVNVLMQNAESIYLKEAIGVEYTSKSADGEFLRKVRIGEANFNYLTKYFPLLNPLHPTRAFVFFSHKVLRWFSPHLLILLFLSNLFLLIPSYCYSTFFVLQCLFYFFAYWGSLLNKKGKKSKLTTICYYFVTMNWALLLGFFQSLNAAPSGGGWERVERDEE